MFDAGSETVVEVVEGDSLAISCYARGQMEMGFFIS